MKTTKLPKLQSKICPVCGRSFTNRKKWADRGQWDTIIYCSKKCRAAKPNINS